MIDEELYERWRKGEVKVECDYCGKEIDPKDGDFFYPDEVWLHYSCLEEVEREEMLKLDEWDDE